MIRKFRYKPSLELLSSGLSGVLLGLGCLILERYDAFNVMFIAKMILASIGFLMGFKFIREFFQQYTSGHIAVSDTFVQLPQYLLKPKQIDFKDIIFVSEREAADGIIKISSKSGFDEIKRKFMIPGEFEELLKILKENTKE